MGGGMGGGMQGVMQMFMKYMQKQMGGGGGMGGGMGGGFGGMGGGMKGGGKGKGKQNFGPDPAGSGRVFVRGFDFGTNEQMLRKHMSQAGKILQIQWQGKGEAAIIYSSPGEA